LVFFSDGCKPFFRIRAVDITKPSTLSDTIHEMDKFFQDAKRLADDVSQNQTFYTVKPLLNFWGAFTPSEEVKRPPKSFFTLNHIHVRVALVLAAFQKGKVIFKQGHPSTDIWTRTPYGLYRDGTELRAVYYNNPEVAHAACDSMKDQCDFPILLGELFESAARSEPFAHFVLGNDPFYGGTLPHPGP